MATESSMWSWFKKARDQAAPKSLHMSRQENLVVFGQPDTEGCYTSVQWWLEFKVAKRPARWTTRITYGSPIKLNQIEWAEDRWAAGGKCGFLIQVGDGADRRLYLIPGNLGRELAGDRAEAWLLYHSVIDVKPTALEVVQAACRLNAE